MSKKGRVGSSFEDFLKEEGVLEETNAIAVKRVLAWQLEQAMEKGQISKRAMAAAMKTSRSQLDRILDPDNDRIRLDTLTAAAHALGLSLRIELVQEPREAYRRSTHLHFLYHRNNYQLYYHVV